MSCYLNMWSEPHNILNKVLFSVISVQLLKVNGILGEVFLLMEQNLKFWFHFSSLFELLNKSEMRAAI